MNIIKLILNLLLLAGVVYLGYTLYNSIKEPIVLEAEKDKRRTATIEKLKDIRKAQIAFRKQTGAFAGDFDTLLTLIKTDSFDVVKTIGDPNDSTIVVKKELVKKSILDSLFKGDSRKVDALPKVPVGDDLEFRIRSRMVEKNAVEIPAFEVSVPYDDLYKGIKKKYWLDLEGEKLKVGDIREATTTGNWEN